MLILSTARPAIDNKAIVVDGHQQVFSVAFRTRTRRPGPYRRRRDAGAPLRGPCPPHEPFRAWTIDGPEARVVDSPLVAIARTLAELAGPVIR